MSSDHPVLNANDPVATAAPRIPKLKFNTSDRFIRELRHRVDAYFEKTGRPRRDCPQMYFKTATILAWFVTAYGVVWIAARAIRHAIADMRGSLQLQGRAMPTLLFVTFFLFFTSELWQLMNHLSWGRLVLVLALFAAVTVLATSARLRNEIDRVEQDLSPERLDTARAGTPLTALGPMTAAPPPALSPRQETNVLLVLVTRQLVQAAVVGLGLFAFFVVLGLIVVDHTVAVAWIGAEPQR